MVKEFRVRYMIDTIYKADSKKEAEESFYSDMATERIGVATHNLKVTEWRLRKWKK